MNPMDETFQISISQSERLSEVELREIEEVDQSAFTGPEDDIDWSGSEWHVIGRLAERIVSIAGILKRRIRVGEVTLEVGGIGGVATHPDYQKHGYGSAVMQRAAEFMQDDLHVEFGLLVCDQETASFYGKLGWQISPAELVFNSKGTKQIFQDITMVLPLSSRPWPVGRIDLCGTPW